jgi:hypothetical protein
VAGVSQEQAQLMNFAGLVYSRRKVESNAESQ